jgi:16S rRNA (guanine(966)-N(2))-methyltransferase RsmD
MLLAFDAKYSKVAALPAMRVIAGRYRSRPLRSMPGLDLRPTSDRLRETLFNVLTAGNPSGLEGTVWVDLFAGTGAVGIEALSRGAAMVHFVESSAKTAQLIQKNLQSLGITTNFEVLKQDAVRAVAGLKETKADFVFLDPPYRMSEAYKQTLESLAGSSLLKPDGTAIAEHDKRFDPGEKFEQLERFRKLEQGDSALSFYRNA